MLKLSKKMKLIFNHIVCCLVSNDAKKSNNSKYRKFTITFLETID